MAFVIGIFCLSAAQSTVLIYEEKKNPEAVNLFNVDAMRISRAAENDFESAAQAYSYGGGSISEQDLFSSMNYLRATLSNVAKVGRQYDAFDSQEEQKFKAVEKTLADIEKLIKNRSFEKDPMLFTHHLSLLNSSLSDFRAGIFSKMSQNAIEKIESEHEYLFMSIASMVVSGLGLILLLLLKLGHQSRLSDEKTKMMGLLEARIAAMESSIDGVVIINRDGVIKYVNKSLAYYHGYDATATLIGKSWRVLFSPEQCQMIEFDIFPQVTKNWYWRGQCRGLRAQGSEYTQDLSMTLLTDGGQVWVVRDNTEYLENLEVSNKRLAAMEAAGDGIGIVDPRGKLTYINQALMTLHGFIGEDIKDYIGKPWEMLYSEKGRADIHEKVMPILMEKKYWKGDAPLVRKDGSVTYAEMSLTMLPDGGMIGTARDVSDRKKAERERDDMQQQFFQAQKMEAIGRLAGGIAHDFNNILAALIGYAEFLVEDLEEDSETQKFAKQIMQGGLQAKSLVAQILAFSRRNESAKETINIIDTVMETNVMLEATMPATVILETRIDIENAWIRGNSTQLSQTIMNLCVNAIDAMEDSKGILTVAIESVAAEQAGEAEMLSAEVPRAEYTPPVRIADQNNGAIMQVGILTEGKRYIRVSVADTGHGMTRQVMEHIFEPFFTTKSVDEGTGLGLSTVHGIVTGHGGAMTVNSVIGEGTIFNLYFPEELAERKSYGDSKEDQKVEKGQGRILIVEDQDRVREMFVEMVGRMGYDVHACASGTEAVVYLQDNAGAVDLVMADQIMPGMTGTELAVILHANFPGLCMLLISGYSRKKLQQIMEENPSICATLQKPVESHTLSREIKNAMKSKRKAA